jgi:hypothetical protein
LIKAETDLVDAARARGGLDVAPESARELTGSRIARPPACHISPATSDHRCGGGVTIDLPGVDRRFTSR